MKILVYLLLTLCVCSIVFKAQSQVTSFLSGIILDAETGTPIPDIAVYTKFSDANADRLGRFNLSMTQCSCQPGDQITIYTFNESYGYSENKYTLPKDVKQDITLHVYKSLNIICVNGIVKDRNNHAPIGDIEVKIGTGNIPANITDVTDKHGTFKLLIPKKYLGNENSVRLVYTDNKHRYEQWDEEQRVNSFARVFLISDNGVLNQNPEADSRRELSAMGMRWQYSDFMGTLKNKDLMAATLFVKGGMKLNAEDFVSYFRNYYSDTLTSLFIQSKAVNAAMCPLEDFDAPDFYESVAKEHQKAVQIRTICGTKENMQLLSELITIEERKVNLFRQEAGKIERQSACVNEILEGQSLNVDSLFFKMYKEAGSSVNLLFDAITYTSRQAVLAKLTSFLLLERGLTNTNGLAYLKSTIKELCPHLFVLIEADDVYLKKLKRMKMFLTGNLRT